MSEIAALPWNGFNVVSTFSGAGGSCLGYRLAGFKVLWANEFIPAARETYRANHPDTFLDERDIRVVQAADILAATGLGVGDIDLFDGSPPCSSFSMAGSREKGWGAAKAYSGTMQRTDDLFFEYARLLRGLQPKTFVAENGSGLIKGTAKGYFFESLQGLTEAGYEVVAKLLDAQWLGVPQQRKRLIFVGVRRDLFERYHCAPTHPKPLPYHYTVREAIPWIVAVKHGGAGENWKSANLPNPTIVQSGARISPTAYFSGGTYCEALVPVGVEYDNGGWHHLGDITDRPAPTITVSGGAAAHHFKMRQQRVMIEDGPSLDGYAIGEEWEKIGPGEKSGRYFQLERAYIDGPVQTITASGGHTGTASVTHPTEKRKFTIAELKRLGGFPDDFVLCGSYEQQWERIGRAVPPVMMGHVAAAVRDGILQRCQ